MVQDRHAAVARIDADARKGRLHIAGAAFELLAKMQVVEHQQAGAVGLQVVAARLYGNVGNNADPGTRCQRAGVNDFVKVARGGAWFYGEMYDAVRAKTRSKDTVFQLIPAIPAQQVMPAHGSAARTPLRICGRSAS